MKISYYIKYDQRIRRIIGCDRATKIFDRLEFYFSRQPDGFYKFIEPNSHKLYKKDDSWTELLSCHRTSFWRAFKLIGKKHDSHSAFQKSKDKFEGKLYASYYDRLTNRMFFIRNHNAVKEFFVNFQIELKSEITSAEGKEFRKACPGSGYDGRSVRTEQNARSYIEAKNTSNDLSRDKSHATSDDIIKKMIELWVTFVEEGGGQIELTSRRIAFLKKAFVDKFNSCLEQWKKYCQDIASSRFLMGEIKSSFRATLDWALKFDIIQKIFEGNYGIGDRNPFPAPSAAESFLKNSKIELASEEEAIQKATNESEPVMAFRLKWLNKFGAANYRECLKDCAIEVRDDATLILRPSSRYNAKLIASYWMPTLLDDSSFVRSNVIQQEGGLVFDKWFGEQLVPAESAPENELIEVKDAADLLTAPIAKALPEESTHSVEKTIENTVDENPAEEIRSSVGEGGRISVTPETVLLRRKLRQALPKNHFPGWLETIEVEAVNRDGTIVVTLEDSLAVGWCRSRFSNEIFQSAISLWRGVNKLLIRQKLGDTVPVSVENLPKKSENVGEESTLEQAIRSLLSVCSPINSTVGGQWACQSFV